MKTRALVRIWAPLVAAVLFAAAFLALHFSMETRENEAAVAELNELLDTAEARAADEQEQLAVFNDDADAAALHKARTVMRFLAHDDTLLETDALAVLCELIDLKTITVADSEGVVTAASDAALIGTEYATDTTLSWSMSLLDDGAQPMVTEEAENVRVGGVQRTDIDGYVLVWDSYGALENAAGLAGAVENLATGSDSIMLVATEGEDGVFYQDGNLYVQRSEGAETLIAYRPLTKVHAVQNTLMTGLAIFAGITLVCMFAWQIFDSHLDKLAAEYGDEPFTDDPDGDEARLLLGDGDPDETDDAEDGWSEPAPRKKKKKKRRKPLIEWIPVPDADGEDDEDWPDDDADWSAPAADAQDDASGADLPDEPADADDADVWSDSAADLRTEPDDDAFMTDLPDPEERTAQAEDAGDAAPADAQASADESKPASRARRDRLPPRRKKNRGEAVDHESPFDKIFD